MGMVRVGFPRLVRGAAMVLFWSALLSGGSSVAQAMGDEASAAELEEASAAELEEEAGEEAEAGQEEPSARKEASEVAESHGKGGARDPVAAVPRGVVGEEEGAILQSRAVWDFARGEGAEGPGPFSQDLTTLLPMMPENTGVVPRILPRIYYREGPDEVFGPGNVHYVIRGHETIVELSMSLGLGFNEIYAPNRDVPVWVPEPGTVVEMPLLWILPRAISRSDIVINLPEMRLYHRLPDGSIESFSVGIGREGFESPLGKAVVTDKKKDPTWIVPESILKDDPTKPRIVKPGPDNPLGDRAIYLTLPGYRIHGTNQPYGLGRRVSHGCIRLYPEDIRHLFETVFPGDKVIFVDETVKAGWRGLDLFLEVHEPLQAEVLSKLPMMAAQAVQDALNRRPGQRVLVNWEDVREVAHRSDGVVTKVGHVVSAGRSGEGVAVPRITADLIYPYQHMQPLDRSQYGRDLAVAENKPVFSRRLVSEDMVDEPLRKPVRNGKLTGTGGAQGARRELTPAEMERLGAMEAAFEAEGDVSSMTPAWAATQTSAALPTPMPPAMSAVTQTSAALPTPMPPAMLAPTPMPPAMQGGSEGGAEEGTPPPAEPPLLKREAKVEGVAAAGETAVLPKAQEATADHEGLGPEVPPKRKPVLAQ